MAIISFKCPNCGGELIFDPATQKYKCEYCNSLFTQEELDAMSVEERDRCKFMGEMSGRSWEFRRTQYQICLSLKVRTRVTGAAMDMRSQT
mgnify:CR=1 FL=1